jgi:opacity protein-like surface antigen
MIKKVAILAAAAVVALVTANLAQAAVNPQGVSGVGSVSGAGYRGTGETLSTFSGHVSAVSTLANNFRIIGTGGAASLQVHENVALVVNANGTLTASVDHVSVTCG